MNTRVRKIASTGLSKHKKAPPEFDHHIAPGGDSPSLTRPGAILFQTENLASRGAPGKKKSEV